MGWIISMPQTKIVAPHSLFVRLFVSVFLALIVFAIAMIIWVQVAHNHSDSFNNRAVARQIAYQLEPFLMDVDQHIANNNRLQARFSLVVIKKTLDIFDESLNAKIGLYGTDKRLILQTDDSNLPPKIMRENSWLTDALPMLLDYNAPHIQVRTQNGYTIWYEKRHQKEPSAFAAFFNLLTGVVMLILIMGAALFWLAKSLTKRINEMSHQIGRFGDGDFSVRVDESGEDEIAVLARGFNQSAQKIEQLICANQLLLAHASHEFRTPITRIRLQVEMLDMMTNHLDESTKAQFNKRATAINKDLTGLNDLIESILLVSRLDAGHALEQMQTVDFYELVHEECQHYSNTNFYGESVSLTAQPKLLTHLIRNLLNNAFVHGTPPVDVFLYGCQTSDEAEKIPDRLLKLAHFDDVDDTNSQTQPTQTLSDGAEDNKSKDNKPAFLQKFFYKTTEQKPSFVVLAVIDHGEGIPFDKRTDIFSPFVRLKQEKKGSGLGLSLVAQIVEMHKGTIMTDTWQGRTRFLAVLPTTHKSSVHEDGTKNETNSHETNDNETDDNE